MWWRGALVCMLLLSATTTIEVARAHSSWPSAYREFYGNEVGDLIFFGVEVTIAPDVGAARVYMERSTNEAGIDAFIKDFITQAGRPLEIESSILKDPKLGDQSHAVRIDIDDSGVSFRLDRLVVRSGSMVYSLAGLNFADDDGAYRDIGVGPKGELPQTPEQAGRVFANGYNAIIKGDVKNTFWAGGVHYTPEMVAAMTEEQRIILARAWMNQYEGSWDKRDAYFSALANARLAPFPDVVNVYRAIEGRQAGHIGFPSATELLPGIGDLPYPMEEGFTEELPSPQLPDDSPRIL